MKELSGRVEEAEEERQTERQARLRADNQRADLARQAVMYCTIVHIICLKSTFLLIKVIKELRRELQRFKDILHQCFSKKPVTSESAH